MPDRAALDQLIAALEAQRGTLGDAAVDSAIEAVRERMQPQSAGVAASTSDGPRLRQVSVLFCDIVGSTAMLQGLDAEDALDVVGNALRRFGALVEDTGGRVLRYTGDGLKAAFGSEQTREDDAERAVHAGLAILDASREHAQGLQSRLDVTGFAVRVGIDSGDVLLGGGPEADRSAMGHAVHMAARLEQAALPGQLLIGERTWSLVRGRFEVQAQAPLHVKGADEPIGSYLVQRAHPRRFGPAGRGVEGLPTRMIGRDAELRALQDALAQVTQPGAGLRRVLVVADAGVGKSRLLYEFQQWAEGQPLPFRLLQARATPQSPGQPYGLLRDLLAHGLGVLEADDMVQLQRRFEHGLQPLLVADGEAGAEAAAHQLGHLIGLDYAASRHVAGLDARQLRHVAFGAAAQVLRRFGTHGGGQTVPVVVELDDLHWADDASLDFLDYLGKAHRDAALLIVALARPTLLERRAALATPGEGERHVVLQPLDPSASAQLVDELLRKLPDAPPELRAMLTGRAAGNPYYMEELLKMLIDQGWIGTAGPRWQLDAEKLNASPVPRTLTGVLQARLDGLPPPERHALQLASVVGMHFWDAALAHVEAGAEVQLQPLARRELIHAQSEAVAAMDTREYTFHHALLHQVTYDTVLKPVKRRAHARTADWLAHQATAQGKNLLGTAAEHYEQAGDPVNAAEFYARAAEYMADTYANEAALDYTARALRLLDTAGISGEPHAMLRWRLLARRERVLDLLGRRDAQRADIDALQALADGLPAGTAGDAKRAEAAWRRCYLTHRLADWALCCVEAQRAQALADRAGDDRLALLATTRLALSMAELGGSAAAIELTKAALVKAQQLDDPEALGELLNTLVVCDQTQGVTDDAHLQYMRQSLAASRRAGNRGAEALALVNLGVLYLRFGLLASARTYVQEGLALRRTLGNRRGEGFALHIMSFVAWREGDAAQALNLAQSSLDVMTEVSARDAHTALWNLGNAQLALGRWQTAAATFERHEAQARALAGAHDAVLNALDGLLRVALARRDAAGALELSERLLVEAGSRPDRLAGAMEHLIRLSLYRAFALAGDPRAAPMLAEAHEALMAVANRISDAALRESFLTNIAEHREIVELWRQNGAA